MSALERGPPQHVRGCRSSFLGSMRRPFRRSRPAGACPGETESRAERRTRPVGVPAPSAAQCATGEHVRAASAKRDGTGGRVTAVLPVARGRIV